MSYNLHQVAMHQRYAKHAHCPCMLLVHVIFFLQGDVHLVWLKNLNALRRELTGGHLRRYQLHRAEAAAAGALQPPEMYGLKSDANAVWYALTC